MPEWRDPAAGDRLHPAAIAVYAVEALRNGAAPLVIIIGVSLFGGGGIDTGDLRRAAIYAAIGTVVAGIAGAVRWATTTYSLAGDTVRLRVGFIGLKETDVPFARVQSLDTEQGPVQRLFGVHAVHVQTGGGGAGGEIVLGALDASDVERIRALLAQRRPEAAVEERPTVPERRLTRPRLLLAALTSGQIGFILPVLAAAGQLVDDVFKDPVAGERTAARLLPGTVQAWVLALAGLLALAWLLAAVGAVVAFSGFTASREEERLRIRRGLLQRRTVTLPVARIRAVRVVEGVLRRPLRLATLRIEVVGYAKEPAAAQTLFPLLRRAEVRTFLDELLPELADGLDGLRPPPPRAARRYVLPPSAAALVAAAAAGLALHSPPVLLAALLGPLHGWLRWRAAGWRLGEDGRLAIRDRRLARSTILAPAANRESHALAQTVLQRRPRLADLEVAFGKRTTARIRHLDADDARGAWSAIAEG